MGVAGWDGSHYLGSKMMRLPRPASPRALWRDVRSLLSQRSPHQLIAAVMAISIPLTIVIIFAFDFADAKDPPEQIIYVDSWRADRSVEETRAAITEQQKQREEAQTERRRQFQRIQNSMKQIGL